MADEPKRTKRGLIFAMIAVVLIGALGWNGVTLFVGPAPLVPADVSGLDREVASAIENASSRVRMFRGSNAARVRLGNIYEANGLSSYAADTYAQVIDTGKGDEDVWYRYAYALERNGELEAALRAIRRSIDMDGSRGYTHWREAMWLLDAGRLEEAEAAIGRAVALDAGDVAAAYAQVRLYLARREGEAALALIDELSLDEPTTGASHTHMPRDYGRSLRADALRLVGRLDEARVVLSGAINTEPSFADPSYRRMLAEKTGLFPKLNRAGRLLQSGRYEQSARILRPLLDEAPEQEYRVHNMLGICEIELGNKDAGFALLDEGLERSQSYESHVTIARAMLRHVMDTRRIRDEALGHARAAVEKRSGFGPAHVLLGKVLSRVGERDEAVRSFRRAYELDAKLVEPRELEGFLLVAAGDSRGAEAVFRGAIAKDDSRGEAYVGLALISISAARAHEADAMLREAAKRTVLNERRFEMVSGRVDRLLRTGTPSEESQ